MIIQKKVEDLYSSISLPSPKQHIRIMYGQLTMSLLSIYFFFKYNSTFFHMHYSTIFVETLQGIFSHFIVLYDRENVGNSQSSYRLIFVSQIISESTNCILRVIFLALEARRAISLGLGSFTFFVLSKNILDNVNKLRESFKKFNDWKRMQSLFNDYLPSANSADIEHDNTCIICRLEMTENDSKKLPCGHCLHTDCLERWTMQQMKCPICRYDLDEMLKEAERKKNEEEKREIIVDNNEQEENVNVNNEQTFTYDELNDDDNGE